MVYIPKYAPIHLSIFFELDFGKIIKENEAPIRILRVIKETADELKFVLTETADAKDGSGQLWQYAGKEKDASGVCMLFTNRLENADVLKCLKTYLIKFPDGHFEDALAIHYKVKSHFDQYDWDNYNPSVKKFLKYKDKENKNKES